jgi:membrane-bound lytic murein transglycosylase D
LEELANLEPEARRALAAFQVLPDYSDYVDWLSERLDLIETARSAVSQQDRPKPTPEPARPGNSSPSVSLPSLVGSRVPYYDLWLERLKSRPKPARANDLLPLLKVIFTAEGLPPELAWLAEVESSLNPTARSPVGAKGLFQLMPDTARSLGLSLLPFDERNHPGKNARAAAKLLHQLHNRFGSWPLALAAYNAGEGKVAVALKKTQARSFADIARNLPAETRMYVPKVFATLTVRENVQPEVLLKPSDSPGEQPAASARAVDAVPLRLPLAGI